MFLKLLCFVVVFNVVFCADSRTILQFLTDNKQYSTLVSAVKSAGLEGLLSAPGALTVLAPTNDAFNALPKNVLDEFLNDKNKLTTLLSFHVVNQTLITPLIGDGAVVSTLSGQEITFHKNGSAVYVNGAYVSSTDTIVDNGVIHTLSTVLIPATENIVQYLVKNDKMFSDLFAAIVVAHLEGPLEKGAFTLFAPTDDAFAKIKNGLPGDANTLGDILKHHVVPGVFPSAVLKDGMTLHTLAGKDLTVKITKDGVMVGTSKVTATDIAATNGIIHVIDTVQTL